VPSLPISHYITYKEDGEKKEYEMSTKRSKEAWLPIGLKKRPNHPNMAFLKWFARNKMIRPFWPLEKSEQNLQYFMKF